MYRCWAYWDDLPPRQCREAFCCFGSAGTERVEGQERAATAAVISGWGEKFFRWSRCIFCFCFLGFRSNVRSLFRAILVLFGRAIKWYIYNCIFRSKKHVHIIYYIYIYVYIYIYILFIGNNPLGACSPFYCSRGLHVPTYVKKVIFWMDLAPSMVQEGPA